MVSEFELQSFTSWLRLQVDFLMKFLVLILLVIFLISLQLENFSQWL